MNAAYTFQNIPDGKWRSEQINEIQRVLESLDIHLELPTKVVWVGNIGEFPEEVLKSSIVTRFLDEVRKSVNNKLENFDLETQTLEIREVVAEVRRNFRLMGGI